MPDGQVLIAGGKLGEKAVIFDETMDLTSPTGDMTYPRYGHQLTLLMDGTVLVTGGYSGSGYPSSTTFEIYDPQTGNFSLNGEMHLPRYAHTATLLQDGTVLIAGGLNEGDMMSGVEIYDPATGTFQQTGDIIQGRDFHTATLLQDGRVLITGGREAPYVYRDTAELFDPVTGTFTETAKMNGAMAHHTATLLPSGRVLIVGYGAEIYDPTTELFLDLGRIESRDGHMAVMLDSGHVLIGGGWGPTEVELFDPSKNYFHRIGQLNFDRYWGTMTLLSGGRVLVTGGTSSLKAEIGAPAAACLYLPNVVSAQ